MGRVISSVKYGPSVGILGENDIKWPRITM